MRINGAAMAAIRERSGETKSGLSRSTGIDLSIISRLESGERKGTPAQIKAIAETLGVPMAAIILGEQVPA